MASSTTYAKSKPLTPVAVHDRIVKIGTGNWAWVQEANGISLHGIVTNIGADTFGLQLHNDPASVTTIAYSDVVGTSRRVSGKTAIVILAVSVGVFVGLAFLFHHEYETHVNQMPTVP